MTTSIPTAPTADASTGAPGMPGAALSQLLASLGGGTETGAPATSPSADSATFASILGTTGPVAVASETSSTAGAVLRPFLGNVTLRTPSQANADGSAAGTVASSDETVARDVTSTTVEPSQVRPATVLGMLWQGGAVSARSAGGHPMRLTLSEKKISVDATGEAAPVTGTETPATTVPTREQLESAAALLAPLWAMLSHVAAPAADGSTPAPAQHFAVTVQLDGQPARTFRLTVPAPQGLDSGRIGVSPENIPAVPTDDVAAAVATDTLSLPTPRVIEGGLKGFTATLLQALSTEVKTSAPALVQTTAGTPEAVQPAVAFPVAQAESVPATAQTATTPPLQGEVQLANGSMLRVTLQPVANFSDINASAPTPALQAVNSAAGLKPEINGVNRRNDRSEKQILTTDGKQDAITSAKTGIAVAQVDRSMFPSRSNRQLASFSAPDSVPARVGLMEMLGATAAMTSTPNQAPAETSQLLPVVAQRAVETVLSLVDGQRDRAEQGGTVNLNFKFGHEDLSVRVQMRGGEIHTQFRTDSPELRAALAVEWRQVATATPTGSLRLAEPEFTATGSGTTTGFDSSAQGQSHSQQQASQQAPAPFVMPELRGLRRSNFAQEPVVETLPRISYLPATSLHLTAVA